MSIRDKSWLLAAITVAASGLAGFLAAMVEEEREPVAEEEIRWLNLDPYSLQQQTPAPQVPVCAWQPEACGLKGMKMAAKKVEGGSWQ